MTITTGQTESLKPFPLIVTKCIPLFHAPILQEKPLANENTL
jgi:hypothetical protein